jgi:hypothetical protein
MEGRVKDSSKSYNAVLSSFFDMKSSFSRLMVVIKVIGEMLFFFGFLAWLDGAVVQITHPEWLPLPISHLLLNVRTDNFTIAMFFVSDFGFFLWRVIAELTKTERSKPQID